MATKSRRLVVGVMGGGCATPEVLQAAEELGHLIAARGWILLNGGRAAGVMQASAKGAREAGGFVVGVVPGVDDGGASDHLDLCIVTGMGEARNVINVLSSDVVVACPGGAGTASEVALAVKSGRLVVLMGFEDRGLFSEGPLAGQIRRAAGPEEAIETVARLLGGGEVSGGGS